MVKQLIRLGFNIFLDLKFHDIPQTVAQACRSAADLGVWMITVHVSGGLAMLKAALQAIKLSNIATAHPPFLVGVTVLTSMDETDLLTIGYQQPISSLVLQLAQLGQEAGLDGVVCSAQEALLLRQHVPDHFLLITPGIRLVEDCQADQKRISTPQEAIAAGANYLVLGRSITQSPHPQKILAQLAML